MLSGKAGGLGSRNGRQLVLLGRRPLGAVYVTNALITVSAIGAGGVAAGTVAGQLIASVAVDRLGLLGLDEVPLTPERIIGVALLFVGTLLIVR